MPATRLDAVRQIRRGAGFELPLEAGGTGRIDGVTRGSIVRVSNPQTAGSGDTYVAATIPAGALVKPLGINTYTNLAVRATDDAADDPVGVALESIPVNGVGYIVVIGYADVLITGTVAPGDPLYASASSGLASAAGSGGIVGYAVEGGTGGSVRALVFPSKAGGGAAGTLCTPTVITPASFVAGSAVSTSSDNPTSHIDYDKVLAGVPGQIMVLFSVAQDAQVPADGIQYHDYETAPGDEPDIESMTKIAQGASTGAYALSSWVLVDPDPNEGTAPNDGYVLVDHAADGWSIQSVMLYRGVGEAVIDGGGAVGTSASPSITVPNTREGDIVLAAVFDPSVDAITSGAGQTERATHSGGFVNRRIKVDEKTADSSGSTTLSWTLTGSRAWAVEAIIIRGDVAVGDGHADLVGTETSLPRCDHAHHVVRTYPPGVTADIEAGYPALTQWTDTTTNYTYLSIDDTEGAAVWIQTGLGSPNVEDMLTSETDTDMVLSPDGAGGVEFRPEAAAGAGGPYRPVLISTGSVAPGATVYIPDASIPRRGSALFSDDGNSGAGMLQWYREGSFNSLQGMATSGHGYQFRGSTYSAGTSGFSFFIENNLAGGRIGIKNNFSFARTFKLWVWEIASSVVPD